MKNVDKSTIDREARELRQAIRPIADEASLLEDGIPMLDDRLRALIDRPAIPSDTLLRGPEYRSRLEEELGRVAHDIVDQIDIALQYTMGDGRIETLKPLLERKREFFRQLYDEEK